MSFSLGLGHREKDWERYNGTLCATLLRGYNVGVEPLLPRSDTLLRAFPLDIWNSMLFISENISCANLLGIIVNYMILICEQKTWTGSMSVYAILMGTWSKGSGGNELNIKTHSALENHICWNDPRDAKILPPIQTLWRVMTIFVNYKNAIYSRLATYKTREKKLWVKEK